MFKFSEHLIKIMEIKPLAADSMGVRSMATLVETKDLKLAIDADAALGPSRYGLPPHEEELKALAEAKNITHRAAKESDALVISHYHFDHFQIGGEHFKNKDVFVKSKEDNINKSQSQRRNDFDDNTSIIAKAIIEADEKEFKYGKTKLRFSPAVPHGPPGIRLGFVVMTLVDDGFKFIHASDVQGPVAAATADWIIRQKPDLLYIDGPPILFLGWKFSVSNLESSIQNFQRILDDTQAEIICDHHLLRSLDYKERFPFFDNPRVKTAADYLGRENTMLEANRKKLYGK
jgi:hypothetical protein